jgi:spore coat-associated protein N
MKRMKVMIGKRRMMVLLTLTVLVLAAAALIASSASFTATSANPGNVFTAGSLSIGNFRSDGTTDNTGQVVASLSMSGMKPGDSTTGTEVIKNTGTLPGAFTLSGVMDTSAANYLAAFAGYLTLTVTEDGVTLVNAQPLSSALTTAITLDTVAAGHNSVFAPAETHTYVFTVKFPNGAAGVENAYMGKSATINLTWSAVQ